MVNILKLKADRAALTEGMEKILAEVKNDILTAEQKAAFGVLKAQHDELTETINHALTAERAAGMHTSAGLPHQQIIQQQEGGWRSLTEQIVAIRNAAINPRDTDARLLTVPNEIRAATGLSEAIDSDGGFLVMPTFSQQILERVYGDQNTLAGACDRFPIGANSNSLTINSVDETSRVNGSRAGGMLAYWDNEADTVTATKPKFSQLNLKLKKLTAAAYATDEVLADTVALTGWLERGVPQELRFRLQDALLNGTGAGQPLGILVSPALVTVSKDTGQAKATITALNVVNMYARFDGDPARARWYINRDTLPQLITLRIEVGTGGVPIFLPAGSLAGVPYNTLLGIPIVPIEQCSTLGTVGDIILADMSKYALIDKGGIQSAASIHLRFLFSEQVFKWVYRVDGMPIYKTALMPFKGTATTSAFVALATRA